MNNKEYLLICLMEECAEVAQRTSKALRFGLAEIQPGQSFSNAERLQQELHDLYSVARLLYEASEISNPFPNNKQHQAKTNKIEEYLAYSKKIGIIKIG